jgi:hypothetical protein
MANALGDPQSASAPSSQQTSNTVAGMSPKQLYQILKDLKAHIQANPEKSRATLKENLVLTKALFQAQILLGMHNPNAQIDGGSEGPLEPQGISAPANGGMTSDAAAEASVLSGAPSAVPSNQQGTLCSLKCWIRAGSCGMIGSVCFKVGGGAEESQGISAPAKGGIAPDVGTEIPVTAAAPSAKPSNRHGMPFFCIWKYILAQSGYRIKFCVLLVLVLVC